MILRPLEVPPVTNRHFVDAWPVVEKLQRQKHESCWLITQPSHAALSGEIAARLVGSQIPPLDDGVIRAIALHDAGWGPLDAEAIMRSRATTKQREQPGSFLQIQLPDFLAAWVQSIEIAQKADPAGGYMVSSHFSRIAEQRISHGADPEAACKRLRAFTAAEAARQRKLAGKQKRTQDELERLTDVLQFCDLLSLYICSGAQDNAEFPEYFGLKIKVTVNDDQYRIVPALAKAGPELSVAGLRYPQTKTESSREFRVTVE